jgi:hypothetical protein
MSTSKRPHVNAYRRNTLRKLCGLEEETRGKWGYAYQPDYVRPFALWHDVRKPSKDLCDRVFCAFLLTGDMTLAVQIGNRNKTLESAIEHAKAIALLKEIANA